MENNFFQIKKKINYFCLCFSWTFCTDAHAPNQASKQNAHDIYFPPKNKRVYNNYRPSSSLAFKALCLIMNMRTHTRTSKEVPIILSFLVVLLTPSFFSLLLQTLPCCFGAHTIFDHSAKLSKWIIHNASLIISGLICMFRMLWMTWFQHRLTARCTALSGNSLISQVFVSHRQVAGVSSSRRQKKKNLQKKSPKNTTFS